MALGTVPLCRGHHRDLRRHGDEAAWVLGLDPISAARGLWLETYLLMIQIMKPQIPTKSQEKQAWVHRKQFRHLDQYKPIPATRKNGGGAWLLPSASSGAVSFGDRGQKVIRSSLRSKLIGVHAP